LGGAYSGLADSADAIAYNPAGLADLERPEATFMHNQYLPGVRQEWLAYAHPTENYGTFAASGDMLIVSPFSTYDTNDTPTGTTSAEDSAFEIAYARGIGAGFSLGAGGQFISSRLDSQKAETEAFDVGVHWRAGDMFEMGVSALHMGSRLNYLDDAEVLPRTIKVGTAVHLPAFWADPNEERHGIDRVSLLADVSLPQGQPMVVAGGTEIGYGPLSIRAGYRSGDIEGPGYTVGIGLALYQNTENRPEIDFDYAFVDYGSLGTSQRAGLTVKFGERRQHERKEEEGDDPQRFFGPKEDAKTRPQPQNSDGIYFSPTSL
jgi:hypothetical protein